MTTNLAVMHLGGEGISGEVVGDCQGINNIEADQGWYLYESWVEFELRRARELVRAGVLDLNAEFDTPVTQGLFVGSPFGIGTEFSQTGLRGPVVWPLTGLGIRAAGEFSDGLHWRLGAYDGAPGSDAGGFTSTRVSSERGRAADRRAGIFLRAHPQVGARLLVVHRALRAHRRRARARRRPRRGNHGFYATGRPDAGLGRQTDFDGALRVGTASGRFNVFDRYAGAAVTASHLWDSRPGDAMGLGIAYAHTRRAVSRRCRISSASRQRRPKPVSSSCIAPSSRVG